MAIIYQKGDLFARDVCYGDLIIHVVNDINRMGSGFVVPLMKRYPHVRPAYHRWFEFPDDNHVAIPSWKVHKEQYEQWMNAQLRMELPRVEWSRSHPHLYGFNYLTSGKPELGNVQFVFTDNELGSVWVANMMAQKGVIGKDNPHPLCYDALESCLKHVVDFMRQTPGRKIVAPKLGAGLAGGDWNRITEIIENVFENRDITVYEL